MQLYQLGNVNERLELSLEAEVRGLEIWYREGGVIVVISNSDCGIESFRS
jgi:hypothetical protein